MFRNRFAAAAQMQRITATVSRGPAVVAFMHQTAARDYWEPQVVHYGQPTSLGDVVKKAEQRRRARQTHPHKRR